jgi:NAD(P)-dependent dehydrogenase (short-subunit alcohol dehydrogenase family)
VVITGRAVVFNASINAHKGMPGTAAYGATKAAVVTLAKTFCADRIERGVCENAIRGRSSPPRGERSSGRRPPASRLQNTARNPAWGIVRT